MNFRCFSLVGLVFACAPFGVSSSTVMPPQEAPTPQAFSPLTASIEENYLHVKNVRELIKIIAQAFGASWPVGCEASLPENTVFLLKNEQRLFEMHRLLSDLEQGTTQLYHSLGIDTIRTSQSEG